MPRRNRRRDSAANAASREERTQVFSRTKMCKFHILGVCTKGDECHFAHVREDLMLLPDLYRTKLCKTLINTGKCEDPSCRYAHNKEEMRVVPGFNTSLSSAMKDESGAHGKVPPEAIPRKSPNDPAVQQAHQQPHSSSQSSAQDKPSRSREARQQQQQQQPQPQQQQPQLQALNMGGGMMAGGHNFWQPFIADPSMSGMAGAVQVPALQQISLEHLIAQATSMQLGQERRPDLMQQAAVLQMGQAAQAHAAEALRLQAMASRLQQGGGDYSAGGMGYSQAAGGNGGSSSSSGRPATGSGGTPSGGRRAAGRGRGDPAAGTFGQSSDRFNGFGDAAHTSVTVKNTFVSVDEGDSSPAVELPQVKTCGARLDSLVPADQKDDDSSPLEPDGPTPGLYKFSRGDPVQIHPGSLKSLSSNSLVGLDHPTPERDDGPAGDEEYRTTPEDQFSWKVKNTFIDVGSPYGTPLGNLRTIHSAAGRLDAMGDLAGGSLGTLPEDKGMFLRQESSCSTQDQTLQEPTEKRSQDTPLQGTSDEGDCGVNGESDGSAKSGADAQGRQQLVREHPLLPAASGLQGLQVKNTFYDFGSEDTPVRGLRSVHTAGGRLADLGGCVGEEA